MDEDLTLSAPALDLASREKHFTTAAGVGIGAFPHLGPAELEAQAVAEGMAAETWRASIAECERGLTELFVKSAAHIGAWPRSRGYYGCDVLLERAPVDDAAGGAVGGGAADGEPAFRVQPKLLEVNYQADLDIVRLTGGDEALRGVVDDIFDTLFTDRIPSHMKRMALGEAA